MVKQCIQTLPFAHLHISSSVNRKHGDQNRLSAWNDKQSISPLLLKGNSNWYWLKLQQRSKWKMQSPVMVFDKQISPLICCQPENTTHQENIFLEENQCKYVETEPDIRATEDHFPLSHRTAPISSSMLESFSSPGQCNKRGTFSSTLTTHKLRNSPQGCKIGLFYHLDSRSNWKWIEGSQSLFVCAFHWK